MRQSTLFSSGLQLAPFVTSSGLLSLSWKAITSTEPGIEGVRLSWKVHSVSFQGKDLKIIAFETIPVSQDHVQGDLVSSSDLKEKSFLDFDFLCSKRVPLFSINKAAVSLLQENHQMLDQLKTEINNNPTPLIVTGHGLAGSVASLFTLSLLNTIGSGKNRPLCITFGSPLIGDQQLQQTISRSSNWNSCFLHVVSHKDLLPRLFITNQCSPAGAYMPFGTFLLCSDAGSTGSENPDFILKLLEAIGSTHGQNQGFRPEEYENIVENLHRKTICKDLATLAENMDLSDSLLASISLQLWALGLTTHMQDIDILGKMKTIEEKFIIQKKRSFDAAKKLNIEKKDMARLEWYKKKTKNQGIGYYDSFKNMFDKWDMDVDGFQKSLNKYWKEMVKEAEMKPQKEGAAFRTRWLHGGNNYRRMVEPLVIARYYRDGGKDYVDKERSEHFKKLEEWLEESLKEGNTRDTNNLNNTNKNNVESLLTLDSCFWARVEEALLSCEELKVRRNEEARNKLVDFEKYVYESLKNYAVSPEIFLPKSSYMRWWNEYKAIEGTSDQSNLANFMSNDDNHKLYALGAYGFPME